MKTTKNHLSQLASLLESSTLTLYDRTEPAKPRVEAAASSIDKQTEAVSLLRLFRLADELTSA